MEKFKKIWFVFLLIVLSIPMMQNLTGWFEEKPLNGAYIPAVRPEFSFKSIWNETYQDSAIKYIEENIGFHNTLVRLNNQMIFSCFHESPIKGPVLGKEKMLFEDSYIVSYTGQTFLGDNKIEEISTDLKTAQEIMKQHGVNLIVILTPGKASFYPELIPDRFHPERKSRNNYDAYIEYLTNNEVNFIDFNSYICNMRDTATEALYCSLSAHWTLYAAVLSLDSTINYMESITNKDYADFTITDFEKSDTLRNQDNDLYKTMNIMFLPKHNEINYPVLKFNNGTDKIKPKVLAIADSYWWTLYAYKVEIPQKLFSDGGFWFYNNTIYPVREPIQNVENINYFDEVNAQDFVLIVTTEATNHLFPYDFCVKYLTSYEKEFVKKSETNELTSVDTMYLDFKERQIQTIISEIKSNQEWLNNIKKQAEEKNIDIETMIWQNADYSYKSKAGLIK